MVEYVKFSGVERFYGQNNLLYSEMGILNIIKRILALKKLRREELMLKIFLKKKIGEVVEGMQILDKLLPHVHFKFKPYEKKKSRDEVEEAVEELDENLRLEQELEQIKMKLARLERG